MSAVLWVFWIIAGCVGVVIFVLVLNDYHERNKTIDELYDCLNERNKWSGND